MPFPDYHVHTGHSFDAEGPGEDRIAVALRRHLPGVGIADHLVLSCEPDEGFSPDLSELDGYVHYVQELKRKYPSYVLLGIEADYRPDTLGRLSALLGSYPFDYVIGSVHHLDSWSLDDPRQMSGWRERQIDDIYSAYYELVGEAAESGLFTILGHLDLVKKFGHRPRSSMAGEIKRLVKRVAASGALVEINTAGLHRPVREAYPAMTILRLLRTHGVGITFGSDAHVPAEVGQDFTLAAAMARVAGYSQHAWLVPRDHGRRAEVRWRDLGSAQGPGTGRTATH